MKMRRLDSKFSETSFIKYEAFLLQFRVNFLGARCFDKGLGDLIHHERATCGDVKDKIKAVGRSMRKERLPADKCSDLCM